MNMALRLTLRLYLDDCINDYLLVRILRDQPYSHEVVTPAEAGLLGEDDDLHFDYARDHGLILITKNPDDFLALHSATSDHPGIFLIYQDNRLSDMQPSDIARAIQNLENAGVPIPNAVHTLNHWRF
jgi:hypothetical protein